jgi:eukaryotic-like serine/threonine-protein kinase
MTPRDSRRIDVRDDGHTRLANTNVGGLPAPRLSGGGGRDFQLSIGRPAIYCAMVQSNVHTITRSKMTDLLADRYRIDSPLGAGGMGEVFLAHDLRLERRVAIKWLRPDHEQDVVARERLRREALAAAALDHPYICKIHEIGDADGRTFIVMEYVEGETLQVAASRELLPVRQIVDIAHELAQALETAHGRGVVHRDLKPSNVMVTTQGHVKVLDFGLARQTVEPATTGTGSDAGTRLTDAGTRLGTPAYMSPEQVLGGTLDHRSDMFSLGVLLHELATGAHPFLRADSADTMAAILRDPPSSGPRDVNSVPGLEVILQRMLAKASSDRVQTMSELRVELEALREAARLATSPARTVISGAVERSERTPFVGREAETTELRRLLDRMLTGHGDIALVGGEPGIGKTRLARELLREAHQRGCVRLIGHCDELAGAPPFAAFIETMEGAVRIGPQAVRTALGDVAPEIATIVPSLRRAFPDIAPSPELPPDQQRRLVFSAYVDYVRRATQQTPVVVLFDDLHWADEPTLQLLGHLAPHVASMRLLVVGTYRDVELDVRRPFAKMLESLIRQRLATRISLRRMTESGVHQMLAGMGGASPPSGLSQTVFKETEGNPFFVEEVFQHLAEDGRLFDATGAWRADLRIGAIDVPEGVRLVIGRRLDRLGDQPRKVLTAAAVIGRTFPIDLLQAVVDVSDDEVLDAIEEAERTQLIAPEVSQRTAQYGFVHELIRATLISGLSLPRRQRVHLKIADALERLRAASLDRHVSALAHHLYQAGAAADSQRAAKFLALAGRRALAAGAFEDALDTAEQLMGLDLADDDPLLAEAYEQRGAALQALQRPDEAVIACERALALHAGRRDDAGIVRAAQAIARSFRWQARLPEAIDVVNRALKRLSSTAAAERASLLAVLTPFLLAHGSPPEIAWDYMDQAVATAERIGNPSLTGHVLHGKAWAHWRCSETESALQAGEQALSLIREEALADRADLMLILLWANYQSGRFADLVRLIPELDAMARRAGRPELLVWSGAIQSFHKLKLTGDLRAFLEDMTNLRHAAPEWDAHFLVLIATARLHLGDTEHALAQMARAAAENPPLLTYKGVAEALLFTGTALVGRIDAARTLFKKVEPWLPAVGERNRQGAWEALDASVPGLMLADDVLRCGTLYPACASYLGAGVIGQWAIVPGNPQTVAGIAAHAAGVRDRARDHFETAIRQADTLPHRLLQPTARYWYGRLLVDDPHPAEQARGRAMVEAAASDFRSLEMVTYANLAEQFLRQ